MLPDRRVLCKIKVLPHRKLRNRWTYTGVFWKKHQKKKQKKQTNKQINTFKIYTVL